MLPITLNAHEVGKAIYYDGRYSFFLSEKLEKMLTRGSIELKFVFGDDMGRESWACRPGANLIKIQIESQDTSVANTGRSKTATSDDVLDL